MLIVGMPAGNLEGRHAGVTRQPAVLVEVERLLSRQVKEVERAARRIAAVESARPGG